MARFIKLKFFIVLNRLPQDKSVRKLWLEKIREIQPVDESEMNFSVCELHFETDQIKLKQGRKRIKTAAIPTIFPNCDDHGHLKSVNVPIDQQEVSVLSFSFHYIHS